MASLIRQPKNDASTTFVFEGVKRNPWPSVACSENTPLSVLHLPGLTFDGLQRKPVREGFLKLLRAPTKPVGAAGFGAVGVESDAQTWGESYGKLAEQDTFLTYVRRFVEYVHAPTPQARTRPPDMGVFFCSCPLETKKS